MSSKLEQLRLVSTVVADTGDPDAIGAFKPVDCTTNPSLVQKAAASARYANIFASVLDDVLQLDADQEFAVGLAVRKLSVRIGAELAGIVPGLVSTEVDPRLSFDEDAMVAEGSAIISDYDALGIGRERVLIKLAATWEGIRAAERLQRAGINTNMTLVFCLDQALACAQAGAFLISPFVGRVGDWYRQTLNATFGIDDHPGVNLVRAIHDAFRRHGCRTIIMAASFRSVEEIEALAGCDRLTIGPALLEALAGAKGTLAAGLKDAPVLDEPLPKISEADFRWSLNADCMATAKLSEGIRLFDADMNQLRSQVTMAIESSSPVRKVHRVAKPASLGAMR